MLNVPVAFVRQSEVARLPAAVQPVPVHSAICVETCAVAWRRAQLSGSRPAEALRRRVAYARNVKRSSSCFAQIRCSGSKTVRCVTMEREMQLLSARAMKLEQITGKEKIPNQINKSSLACTYCTCLPTPIYTSRSLLAYSSHSTRDENTRQTSKQARGSGLNWLR
jgi:hypothetical protein